MDGRDFTGLSHRDEERGVESGEGPLPLRASRMKAQVLERTIYASHFAHIGFREGVLDWNAFLPDPQESVCAGCLSALDPCWIDFGDTRDPPYRTQDVAGFTTRMAGDKDAPITLTDR